MFDLVLNHCSSKSPWFKEYVSGVEPGLNYIMEANPKTDLSMVVRPRSTPLLTPYQTRKGRGTYGLLLSADQVDLDWTSPDLLFEFLDIILYYVSIGCKILRLDAVAFLWKKIGTNCLHLPGNPSNHKAYPELPRSCSSRCYHSYGNQCSIRKTSLILEKETKPMRSISFPFLPYSFTGYCVELPCIFRNGQQIWHLRRRDVIF